jgi:hypothetical protein
MEEGFFCITSTLFIICTYKLKYSLQFENVQVNNLILQGNSVNIKYVIITDACDGIMSSVINIKLRVYALI